MTFKFEFLLQTCIYVFKIKKKFKKDTRDKNTIWLKSGYMCLSGFESQPETGRPASCSSDNTMASDWSVVVYCQRELV